MRCSRKSTTWPASAVAAAWLACGIVLPLAAQVPGRTTTCDVPGVSAVLMAAVTVAAGDVPSLQMDVLTCDVVGEATIDAALPEPGARFGRPARFRLMSGGRQRGYAIAVASGPVAHLRLRRAVTAGQAVGESDVVTVTEDVTGALIEPLPGLTGIAGATAVRDLAAGEIVTLRIVRVPPAVRSGDRVVLRARVGVVHVTGVAMAQQNGGIGDVIRVVNPDSRRVLRGRVIGKSEVEVLHGS